MFQRQLPLELIRGLIQGPLPNGLEARLYHVVSPVSDLAQPSLSRSFWPSHQSHSDLGTTWEARLHGSTCLEHIGMPWFISTWVCPRTHAQIYDILGPIGYISFWLLDCYVIPIHLGPANHADLDLEDLPVAAYEHYLVKHPTHSYECLKCRKIGENVRDEPCTPKESPDYLSKNHKLPFKTTTSEEIQKTEKVPGPLESEESLLEALLEEELALSQMLEEAMAMSLSTTPTTKSEHEESELQKAIALSFEKLPVEVNGANETKELSEENFKKEFETAVGNPQMDTPSPAATDELSQLCSETSLYNMQCLVNMGFTKQQAIWGVKRANDSSGSIDLAVQHASWRCDADILLAKRRRLESLANTGEVNAKCAEPPKPLVPCAFHALEG